MQFWEAMFYGDVQNHIRTLYLERGENGHHGPVRAEGNGGYWNKLGALVCAPSTLK